MQSYSRYIDDFIASAKDLTDGEKMFMGLLHCLTGRYGYCFASNAKLAEYSFKTPRHIRRYLANLSRLGYVVVEIEKNQYRRIWTADRFANKKQYLKSSLQNEHFQNSIREDMDVLGGGHGCPPIYKVHNINKEKGGKEESVRGTKTQEKARPSALAPPLFSEKKIKKTTEPPKAKEQPPSLELTEQDRKELVARFGEAAIKKYEANRVAHLKKCPNSYHHKKLAKDTITEFANKDQEDRILSAKAREEKKSKAQVKRTEKGRKFVKELLTENPDCASDVHICPDGVDIGLYNGITAPDFVPFYAPDLYRKIENALIKKQRHDGIDFKMPMTEDEWLE